MYCKKMEPEGLGDLYLAYEQLKEKLTKEGLFDEKYKKQIPFLPKRVGVITSRTGAVVRDIINVTTRRYPNVNLLIYPAAVQGVNVSSTVIKGLESFNTLNNVDVIIIARGGGSFEDLFGFNDEAMARKIFESKIPVISAVGHETDFTICDFVSDLRAPTPSAAAELVYPEYTDLIRKINTNENRILLGIKNYILRRKEYIKRIKAAKLEKMPLDIISRHRLLIDSIVKNSFNNINIKIEKYKSKTMQNVAKIDALSPLKTLTRGYSVVQNESTGKVIKSINDVKKDDRIDLVLSDGKIKAVVE